MSKKTSTRWYIGAWVVWLIALVVFLTTAHRTTTATSFSFVGTNAVSGIAWLIVLIAALVMLVMWIGALIRLGQLHSWGWFVGVLILQLIGLGIIGMVAYAAAGPEDAGMTMRPTVT
jgi:hypothetical protein